MAGADDTTAEDDGVDAAADETGAEETGAEETGAEDAEAGVDDAAAEPAGTVPLVDTVLCASGEPEVLQAAKVASATPRAATVNRARREKRGERIR